MALHKPVILLVILIELPQLKYCSDHIKPLSITCLQLLSWTWLEENKDNNKKIMLNVPRLNQWPLFWTVTRSFPIYWYFPIQHSHISSSIKPMKHPFFPHSQMVTLLLFFQLNSKINLKKIVSSSLHHT